MRQGGEAEHLNRKTALLPSSETSGTRAATNGGDGGDGGRSGKQEERGRGARACTADRARHSQRTLPRGRPRRQETSPHRCRNGWSHGHRFPGCPRSCRSDRLVPPQLVPRGWRAGAASLRAWPPATLGRLCVPPWRSARAAGPGCSGRSGTRRGSWRRRTWHPRFRRGFRGQAVRWRPGRPGAGSGARRWPRRTADQAAARAAGAVAGLVARRRPLRLGAGRRGHAGGLPRAARRPLPVRRRSLGPASWGRHAAVRGVGRRRSRR